MDTSERQVDHHLHVHRRGPGAGHVLVAPDHRSVRRSGRRRGRDTGHFARRAHPGGLSRPSHRRPAGERCARRTGRSGTDAAGEHHQAAEHQRLGAAAQGGDRRAAGQGIRPARLPGRGLVGRRRRPPRPLRRRHGVGRQPGAPPGQLRPSRPACRQGVRQDAPPLDGGVVARLQDPRGHDGERRLPIERAVAHGHRRRCGAHRVRRRRRRGHGAQGDGARDRRRGHRLHRDERGRAAGVPRRTDRRREGEGRAVLAAPQGHDDEGVRSDHLRSRRRGVLRRPVRAAR